MASEAAWQNRCMASIVVTFKREDSVEGEPIGPLYITDADETHPSWVGHPYETDGSPGAWMSLSDARTWAESRGYMFEEDL
jgi:hypothetical protein